MANLTRRAALASFAVPLFGSKLHASNGSPALAITMDDADWRAIPEARRPEAEERLLAALRPAQAFLFSAAKRVDNPHGQELLRRWAAAGHRIGNHTYSHHALLDDMNPAEFEADILRADALLRPCAGFRPLFRFPALKEGNTREVRDRLRTFLSEHGYRNGAVTIDASDWYYDQRLRQRLEAEPDFEVMKYRQPYLDHLWGRAQYYDGLSREVLNRSVPHTLLVHYNLLNSLFLGDALQMFRARGWRIIDAEKAFADPVFRRQPDTVPAGESLIWALAKETGRFENRLRYPGEDDVYEKPLLDRLKL